MEYVILVDEQDNETGTMEKIQAHKEGLLHRAISVFIFNAKGEMLLQQRAAGKYHSPLLWTNACCSHPRPGELTADAAHRRLLEEIGINCSLEKSFSFTYQAHFDNGLTEHEYDHVFTGVTDAVPVPDNDEVAAWRYMDVPALQGDVAAYPEKYTAWFRICLAQHFSDITPHRATL